MKSSLIMFLASVIATVRNNVSAVSLLVVMLSTLSGCSESDTAGNNERVPSDLIIIDSSDTIAAYQVSQRGWVDSVLRLTSGVKYSLSKRYVTCQVRNTIVVRPLELSMLNLAQTAPSSSFYTRSPSQQITFDGGSTILECEVGNRYLQVAVKEKQGDESSLTFHEYKLSMPRTENKIPVEVQRSWVDVHEIHMFPKHRLAVIAGRHKSVIDFKEGRVIAGAWDSDGSYVYLRGDTLVISGGRSLANQIDVYQINEHEVEAGIAFGRHAVVLSDDTMVFFNKDGEVFSRSPAGEIKKVGRLRRFPRHESSLNWMFKPVVCLSSDAIAQPFYTYPERIEARLNIGIVRLGMASSQRVWTTAYPFSKRGLDDGVFRTNKVAGRNKQGGQAKGDN